MSIYHSKTLVSHVGQIEDLICLIKQANPSISDENALCLAMLVLTKS